MNTAGDSSEYDLAIIGGGINGCGIARDAAGRGWRVFLIPQSTLRRLLRAYGTETYRLLAGATCYAGLGRVFGADLTEAELRDGIGLIASAAETGALAAEADPAQDVYMVPAFVGLGAPYSDSEARALLTGMTRGTTRKELARAVLECVGYQTRDLLDAMQADLGTAWSEADTVIRVDGGMSASDWTMQFLADIVAAPVDRPVYLETTARGAAYLAGMAADLYPDPDTFAATWSGERRFEPNMPDSERHRKYQGWQDAIARTLLRP